MKRRNRFAALALGAIGVATSLAACSDGDGGSHHVAWAGGNSIGGEAAAGESGGPAESGNGGVPASEGGVGAGGAGAGAGAGGMPEGDSAGAAGSVSGLAGS